MKAWFVHTFHFHYKTQTLKQETDEDFSFEVKYIQTASFTQTANGSQAELIIVC